MQETPEEELARLVRYWDTLTRISEGEAANGDRPNEVAPNGAAPSAVAPSGVAPPLPKLRLRTPGPDARAAGLAAQSAAMDTAAEPAREWQYSTDSKWRQTRSLVPATVFGQFLAVFACTLAVLAFEELDHTLALRLVIAGAVLGAIAAARRVPLALWWTFGVVVGGVLGRWS